MKKTMRLPNVEPGTIGKYIALLSCMILMNFALPNREPLSFPLYYAALYVGMDPFVVSASYLFASIVSMNLFASLSALCQASVLLLVFAIYRKKYLRMRLERLLYVAVAQVPFIFLFPHEGYTIFPFAPILQKLVIAFFLFIQSAFFEGALCSLLRRVFRCRLTSGQLAELLLFFVVLGLGILGSLGEIVYLCLALTLLIIGVALLKNAAAVPFSVALALPLCFLHASVLPLAKFVIFACVVLLLIPYGRIPAAIGFVLAYFTSTLLEGLYFLDGIAVFLGVLPCAVAVILSLLLPEKWYRLFKQTLLFYRENALPRIAINRNRRAVGERLYEVSSLFREIESAFDVEEPQDNSCAIIVNRIRANLCEGCPGKKKCENSGIYTGMEKLISIGYAKGQVSLVDLPSDVGAICRNTSGLLFAANKLLSTYRMTAKELAGARESRRLLAQQAHGISEILKGIALEQSEEYSFSEGESTLSAALANAGILSSEIFVYGEGNNLTVSMTLSSDVPGKRLCSVAGKAIGVPLSLSEKIPLAPNRTCYILKRRPNFDAAFGIASVPKEGELSCGDAYSILKIDERRFLVALSDGMGSGQNAREVSDKTLSLLESFYKAKMPSETVLSTVNRLISYSPDETFACLDLAAVDLDSGDADIVKIGSPAGFVLTDDELRVLEGDSLPIGMLETVHPSTLRTKVGENDFLLFMSDGVSSAFGSSSDLCSYLSGLRPLNPQSLAEQILSQALERFRGHAEDDMTVLAVKLLRSA